MEIATDRRSRRLDPDPLRVLRARRTAGAFLELQLQLARELAAIERGRDFLRHGHASVWDFAVDELGLARGDVTPLLRLGRVLDMAVPPEPEGEPGDGNTAGGDGSADDGADEQPDGGDGAGPGLFGAGAGGPADGSDESPGSDAPAPPASDPAAPPPAPPASTVEDGLRGGRLSRENAQQLGRLFGKLGDLSESERADWLQAARTMTPWSFTRKVAQALENAAQPEPTVHMALCVTESARDDFHRARILASRRAGRMLTEGQVFAVAVRRYVEAEDERLIGEKQRRAGPTKLLPGKRYVPAAVVRALRKRSGDRCEVPGCSNSVFLQLMHLRTPHARGGGREERDLAVGCDTHHVLYDAGVIRYGGWTEPDADGVRHPRFRAANGRLLGANPPRSTSAARPPP